MIDLLLKNSGFYIDKNEHNMFKSELTEMIEELEILTKICEYDTENRVCVDYSTLREDETEKSFQKTDILSNSKSKTDVGFIINKVI